MNFKFFRFGVLLGTLAAVGAHLAWSASADRAMVRPSVYIEAQNGFETYVSAALTKKHVPIDIVLDRSKATFVLKAAPVEIRSESTGGKIARCLFAYCAGIEDSGTVSVQLVDPTSSKVMWAYSVAKQRSARNRQSMAEAVAKHLKSYLQDDRT